MIARPIGWAAVALTRLAHQLGTHRYLSTGCLHGDHGYCQGKTGRTGAKTPARCKFCHAPCVCPCHTNHPRKRLIVATFLLGLVLGGISGGVTYGLTSDGQTAALVGGIAAVLTWLGIATLIFADD